MSEELHQIDLPEDVVSGVYADFVSIWHTPGTFTFDFAALAAPPEVSATETGEPLTLLKSRVVARIRVPPDQVFEIMKALEQQLTAWEQENRPQS